MSSARTLEIRTSPHVAEGSSVDDIMWGVVRALVPTSVFAVYAFGWAGLLTLAAAVTSCVLAEAAACRVAGRPSTIRDGSVVITGLLYGLTLPPTLPLWMTFVGGFIAVGLGKSLFGGLGFNPFNPALVGRVILQAAFPAAMTTWHPAFAPERFWSVPSSLLAWPFAKPTYDVVSGATALSDWKFNGVVPDTTDLALGFVGGSTGETSAVLILLGGVYLVARRMMSWQIPVAVLGTVAALSGMLHLASPEAYPPPAFMLFSGGLMLGAVFMATDMVGSPMTTAGLWIHGASIGLVTVVIRLWGGMPEGVMYAILLANAFVPLIDRSIQPRVYGLKRRRA